MTIRALVRLALLTLVGATAFGIAPTSALATGYGYVWADNPTAASYTPGTAYQANSTGQLNTINRLFTGNYQVTFPGLADASNGGTVNVTAYGNGTTACEVGTWGSDLSGGVLVYVTCTDTNGAYADSPFTATYAVPPARGRFGYVWANSLTAESYTPDPFLQFNSRGGINTIRRLGTGSYVVSLPGLAGGSNGGTVKVTAAAGHGNRCKVTSWGPSGSTMEVRVQCFNASGSPVDSWYTMTFANGRNLLGSSKGFGYAWANDPFSASYTPHPFYSKTKPQGTINIVRFVPGSYVVYFNDVGAKVRSNVQVTAYGADPAECRVDGWFPQNNGQAVGVSCRTTAGMLTDTYFTVQFIR